MGKARQEINREGPRGSAPLFKRFQREAEAAIVRGLRLHALLPVAFDDGDLVVWEKGDIPAKEAAAGKIVHFARGAADDGRASAQLGS